MVATTSNNPNHITLTGDTSAACAGAARLAGRFEPFVKREMGEDLIADPVLAAAHPLQGHRPVDRVGDHG